MSYGFQKHQSPALVGTQLNTLGLIELWLERPENSLPALKESVQVDPDFLITHIYLAAVYVALRREREARREMQEIPRVEPGFKLKEWVPRLFPFKHEEDSERMMELLSKAGLPNQATPNLSHTLLHKRVHYRGIP